LPSGNNAGNIKWRIEAGGNEEPATRIARRAKVGGRNTARTTGISALAHEERIDFVILERRGDVRCVGSNTRDGVSTALSYARLNRETIPKPELETGEIRFQEDVHHTTDGV
jgi:hypothetical protein